MPALLPTATGPRRRLPWRHAWGTAEVGRGSVAALSPAEGDLAGPFGVWEGDDEAAATAAGAGAGGELCGRGGGDRGVVGGGRMRRYLMISLPPCPASSVVQPFLPSNGGSASESNAGVSRVFAAYSPLVGLDWKGPRDFCSYFFCWHGRDFVRCFAFFLRGFIWGNRWVCGPSSRRAVRRRRRRRSVGGHVATERCAASALLHLLSFSKLRKLQRAPRPFRRGEPCAASFL